MDDILELATRLGKRIANDPRGVRLTEARAALDKSAADRQLIGEYESLSARMRECEMQGQPIEPADKRKLADLQSKVAASRVLKDLMKGQADLVELLHTAYERIETEVFGGMPREE